MRVLFDQGTPAPLRQSLPGHEIATAFERGWSTRSNGDLLDSAEEAGFQVLITTDSNLKYQQNLANRDIAVLVLLSTSWPRIRRVVPEIREALESARPGSFTEVAIP